MCDDDNDVTKRTLAHMLWRWNFFGGATPSSSNIACVCVCWCWCAANAHGGEDQLRRRRKFAFDEKLDSMWNWMDVRGSTLTRINYIGLLQLRKLLCVAARSDSVNTLHGNQQCFVRICRQRKDKENEKKSKCVRKRNNEQHFSESKAFWWNMAWIWYTCTRLLFSLCRWLDAKAAWISHNTKHMAYSNPNCYHSHSIHSPSEQWR